MIKLRENYILTLDEFHNKSKKLSESEVAKKGYAKRLSESIYAPPDKNRVIHLAEALQKNLTEQQDQALLEEIIKELNDKGVGNGFSLWELPVTRQNWKNANGRIYPHDLWCNVRDNQKDAWQGLCGLADHPQDDDDPGKFRDQAVVWHDFMVPEEDEVCQGVGSFVGPYGHLAQEILDHGGRIGTSSSGFGDVGPNNIVDPTTFIIERLADLVLNPSQNTYGSVECAHGPADFMKDPQQGGEITYQRPAAIQEKEEGVSAPKSRIMSEKLNKTEIDAVRETTVNAQQPGAAAIPATEPVQTTAAALPELPAPAQATQPAGAPVNPAPQTPPPIPAAVPPAPAAVPAPVVESIDPKAEKRRKMLASAEEKQFARYVESFMNEMGGNDNPLTKLNEAVEILDMFEEGVLPQLREKFEANVITERDRLQELVEKTMRVQSEVGVDVETLKENAISLAAEGSAYKAAALDYQQLSEQLADKLSSLMEDHKDLQARYARAIKSNELTVDKKNAALVEASSNINDVKAKLAEAITKNEALVEKVSTLYAGSEKVSGQLNESRKENAKLKEALSIRVQRIKEQTADLKDDANTIKIMQEKIDSLNAARIKEKKQNEAAVKELNSKLSEAAGIIRKGKEARATLQNALNESTELIKKATESNKVLKAKLAEATVAHENAVERAKKLREQFENYKYEKEVVRNPAAHMMPRAENRIGKYLDLRENHGQDIEEYWETLKEQWGETIVPFENEIRGAKTLKEATNAFLRHRADIDQDFSYRPVDPTIARNQRTYAQLMEQSGQPVYKAEEVDVEKLNEDFYARMQAQGLK